MRVGPSCQLSRPAIGIDLHRDEAPAIEVIHSRNRIKRVTEPRPRRLHHVGKHPIGRVVIDVVEIDPDLHRRRGHHLPRFEILDMPEPLPAVSPCRPIPPDSERPTAHQRFQ